MHNILIVYDTTGLFAINKQGINREVFEGTRLYSFIYPYYTILLGYFMKLSYLPDGDYEEHNN